MYHLSMSARPVNRGFPVEHVRPSVLWRKWMPFEAEWLTGQCNSMGEARDSGSPLQGI